ncbi:MAG: hypothetical protein IPN71_14280 [Fibrobacteres bacterium]|nr:hypothetical protein [Fibrobacterota bacterium]
MTQLPYQEHVFVRNHPSLLEVFRNQSERLRACLDGWLASRKADIDLASLKIISTEGDQEGFLTLGFDETQWLACRLETGRQAHQVRIAFRSTSHEITLRTLPRDAFGDRVDEF